MAFDLSTYATVEERLAQFWAANPDGRIATEAVEAAQSEPVAVSATQPVAYTKPRSPITNKATYLKDNTPLNENVDDKLLKSAIKEAQEIYIRDVIGSGIYNELQVQAY